MASGACRSCGAQLPEGASFCARCGAAVDDVDVLSLVPAAHVADRSDAEEVDAGPGRTAAVVVLGALLALVGLSILAGEGDDDAESASTTSTTARSTSTTTDTGRSQTTVAPRLLTPGDTLDPSFGMALVHGLGDGLTIVDLGSGSESRIPAPSAVAQLAWTGELLLVRTAWSIYRPADDGSGGWREVALDGWNTMAVRGPLIELGRPGEDAAGVASIDGSGAVHVWPVDPMAGGPAGASPVGVVAGRLVLRTIDGIFLLDQGGDAERIASGVALAVSGSRVLRHSCDERMDCTLSVVDVAGGEEEPLPALPDGRVPFTGWLGPGADEVQPVLVTASDPAGAASFVLADGGWTQLDGDEGWWAGAHAWAEGGSGLVWWDWQHTTVRSVGLRGTFAGVAGSVDATGDPQVARRSDPGAPLVVVPLSALPPEWRPG